MYCEFNTKFCTLLIIYVNFLILSVIRKYNINYKYSDKLSIMINCTVRIFLIYHTVQYCALYSTVLYCTINFEKKFVQYSLANRTVQFISIPSLVLTFKRKV